MTLVRLRSALSADAVIQVGAAGLRLTGRAPTASAPSVVTVPTQGLELTRYAPQIATPFGILSVTSSMLNTADTTPDVAYPAHSIGDLVVLHIGIDDDDTITLPSAGPGSETIVPVINGNSGSTSGPAIAVCYFIANGTRAAGTLAFAVSGGGEEWIGRSYRVPAGTFNADDPVTVVSSMGGNSGSDSVNVTVAAVTPPNLLATNGIAVFWGAADADAFSTTNPSGWTALSEQDIGAISGKLARRTALAEEGVTIGPTTFTLTPSPGDTSSAVVYVLNPLYTGPLAILDTSIPPARIGQSYSHLFDAIGGDGELEWTLEEGALPAGLSLSSLGLLSGTPEEGGAYPLTIRVTDESEEFDELEVSLSVSAMSLDWEVNWNNGTGAGSNALRNTNLARDDNGSYADAFAGFTVFTGQNALSIVEKTQPGGAAVWPSWVQKVLQIQFGASLNPVDCMLSNGPGAYRTPEIGEFIYFYSYDVLTGLSTGQSINAHHYHYGSPQGSDHGIARWFTNGGEMSVTSGGKYGVGFGVMPNMSGVGGIGRGQGHFSIASKSLDVGRVYKRVVRIQRTGTSTAKISPRVWDFATGTLVHDENGWRCETGACATAGGFGSDNPGDFDVTVSNWDAANGWQIGNNGIESQDDDGFIHVAGLGVLVTADDDAWDDPRGV